MTVACTPVRPATGTLSIVVEVPGHKLSSGFGGSSFGSCYAAGSTATCQGAYNPFVSGPATVGLFLDPSAPAAQPKTTCEAAGISLDVEIKSGRAVVASGSPATACRS